MITTSLLATMLLWGQSGFVSIADDADFLRPATRNRQNSDAEKGGDSWFRPSGDKAFENKRIPPKLLDEADLWIRRMIAPSLLPDDLRARLRGARQEKGDWIYVHYRTPGGEYVQIAESSSLVVLTIKTDQVLTKLEEEPVKEFVTSVVKQAIRLSESQVKGAEVTYRLWEAPPPGGFARGTFAVIPPLPAEDQSWWNSVFYGTDGDTVRLGLSKVLPGMQSSNGQGADPFYVYRPRFGG